MFKADNIVMQPDRWPSLVRGLLAYGSAEAVTRVVRLGSILVVARQVSPEILGAAAIVLSLFEITRVLTSVGIGQRLIVAGESELPALCNTAHRLFWIVCLGVSAIQLVVALIASLLLVDAQVGLMLAALSLVYLFMPAGLVQIFLAMRAQRMAATAHVAATQNIADCALTVILVLLWPSAWALVLPKLLTAPVWLVMARRTWSWEPDRLAPRAPIAAFSAFGPAVLGSEMLSAVRLHADKLLVGALLGTEALGLYYFAFNAGLGITQSIVSAFNLVLFPHLASLDAQDAGHEFRKVFWCGLLLLVPLVAAQALLAPVYVPIVFGANWVGATPYLAILACAAVPLFAAAVLGARFRASGAPYRETAWMAAATFAALCGIALGSPLGLAGACGGFVLGLTAVLAVPTLLQLSPRAKHNPSPAPLGEA